MNLLAIVSRRLRGPSAPRWGPTHSGGGHRCPRRRLTAPMRQRSQKLALLAKKVNFLTSRGVKYISDHLEARHEADRCLLST